MRRRHGEGEGEGDEQTVPSHQRRRTLEARRTRLGVPFHEAPQSLGRPEEGTGPTMQRHGKQAPGTAAFVRINENINILPDSSPASAARPSSTATDEARVGSICASSPSDDECAVGLARSLGDSNSLSASRPMPVVRRELPRPACVITLRAQQQLCGFNRCGAEAASIVVVQRRHEETGASPLARRQRHDHLGADKGNIEGCLRFQTPEAAGEAGAVETNLSSVPARAYGKTGCTLIKTSVPSCPRIMSATSNFVLPLMSLSSIDRIRCPTCRSISCRRRPSEQRGPGRRNLAGYRPNAQTRRSDLELAASLRWAAVQHLEHEKGSTQILQEEANPGVLCRLQVAPA
jgi:hypothetical protein